MLTAASVLVLGASAQTQTLPPGDLTLDTKAFGNPNNLSEPFPSATVGEPFYYEVTINKSVNTSTVDAVFLDTLPLNVIVTDLRGQTECRAESKNIIICNVDDLGQPNVVGKILVFEVCATEPETVTKTATVASANDPDATNNAATEEVTVILGSTVCPPSVVQTQDQRQQQPQSRGGSNGGSNGGSSSGGVGLEMGEALNESGEITTENDFSVSS